VTYFKICTVMFVLFTDCVNNIGLTAVDERHE